ncbi:unnamed protein product [Musa acuminata subsp. burmannicoides]
MQQQQQQQQQQQGGATYGLPPSEMAPFSTSAVGPGAHLLGIPGPDPLQQQQPLAEAASPISSRPPPAGSAPSADFDELVPAVAGNFPDDVVLAAGDDAERGTGATANRWPRQETVALLKIRSEMDAAFRDATLKGPLWEEVSRKLAELGYKRSAKKCKEKFENVHKYYKRTKDGRAGRQDGKSYRFFSQLEALHSGSAAAFPPPAVAASSAFSAAMAGPPPGRAQPISAVAPPTMAMPTRAVMPEMTPPLGGLQGISSLATGGAAAAAMGISFSSNSSSSSSSESDEETEEAAERQEGRKRKHSGRGSGNSRKMMAFFDRLMRQVMERQEVMQQQFLEAIEKREQDRMIRDEAWRRQEMARLNREQEVLAQERAMAASRDTAIISYLQKISGQTFRVPAMPATPISIVPLPPHQPSHAPPPQPAAPQQQLHPPPLQQQKPVQPLPQKHEVQRHLQSSEIAHHQPSSATESVPGSEPQDAVGRASLQEAMSSSSRWPKAEVHALIKIRSALESKFQDAGPKGPLWEEISARMQQLGYNRRAKRCKEKWENINKYFKKVKESNKLRPEDSKTCPYFHQLDTLYRNRLLGSSSGSGSGSTAGIQRQQGHETNPPSSQQQGNALTIMPQQKASPPPPQSPQQQQPATEVESNNGKSSSDNNQNGGNSKGGGGPGGSEVPTSNGELSPSFFDVGLKKPEDIVKELMEEPPQQSVMDDYEKLDEADSINLDQDDDEDDDDDDEARKMQYKIQFQRQNVSAGGGGNESAAAATAGSFLAIVQ